MRKTRTLAALLALAMLVGLLPTAALAAWDSGAPAPRAAESGSIVGAAYSEDPQAYEIYPVPHSVVTAKADSFTLTAEVNVVVGAGVDTYTTDFLRELLTRFGHTMTTSAATVDGKSNIVLAIHGDADPFAPSAYPDLFTAEDKYDPYLLRAEASSGNQNGVITIIGKDADCVYYGVSTLQMMFTSFNGEKFLPVQIEDYSNTALRGFIEGFYGGFTYPARESQMRAIRDVKGNMYVFSSKTDPYHGAKWAELYPADELAEIEHLVSVGKEVKVEYVWSVHIGIGKVLANPGTTISDEDYATNLALLKAKFQQLYDVGVRNFHILNDDTNSGTYATQVRLLNDVNAWLQEKGDCGPLVYCIGGYNVEWSGWSAYQGELAALKNSNLDPDILFYWTGSRVNSPITQENINYLYENTGHYPVTWLNYPCSEHDKAGIYLGNISHYVSQADGLQNQMGIISNPINYPEANKVAYFQLLSWGWNRDNYTSYLDELWKDSFKYLQPEVWRSYYTIAQNVSNCPDSGRYPEGFPESEHLTAALEAVQTALLSGKALADIPEAAGLMDELDNILAAIDDFRANCANAALLAELEPWLQSLGCVVSAAKSGMLAADALAGNDVSGAWNHFSAGAVALGQWDSNPPPNTASGYPQARAKGGSKRLQPFANTLLNDYVRDAMAQQLDPGGSLGGGVWTPMVCIAGTGQSDNDNTRKMFDGDPTSYASYNTNQHADDYIGVDLGEVKVVTSVDILQGQSDTDHDYFHKAAVEYSVDGEHWATLVTKVNAHHILVEDLSVAARYVRMRLLEVGYQGPNFEHNGGANYWTHLREFTVTTQEPTLLYTDLTPSSTAGLTAAADGGAYTLTVPSLTLAPGSYVGVRLPELTGIRSVTASGTLPGGVVLEWSVNGETWSQTVPAQTTLMGYARLRATAAATLSNVTLTAAAPVATSLSVAGSVPASADWSNAIDGDRSTKAYISERQAYGQYVILDLGGLQPVHDVTLVVPEGDSASGVNALDIPHNLDFFVSTDSDPDGSWSQIGSLRSGTISGNATPDSNTDITDPSYEPQPPYRVFQVDGNGVMGRYLKVALADVVSFRYYYVSEIEVNQTVTREEPLSATSSTSGNAAHADDGNLLTFLTPDSAAAGSWQKLLAQPTTFDAVTILRSGSGGASAAVEVQQNGGWKKLGSLSQSATTLALTGAGAIIGLRVTWTASDVPQIAEVIFAGAALPAGDPPLALPNIFEQPAQPGNVTVANATALENIPLPDRVSVTTSSGAAVNVPVIWDCADYDAATAGAYTFSGVLDAAAVNLTNPGGFALTAQVTVNPAPAGSEATTGNLALNHPAYASGREVSSQSPDKAVDGTSSTWWSGNKMKHKDNSTYYDTIEDAVSWITVDLGAGVSAITQVELEYNAKVWPLEYYVQVGGSGISYDGYTTPDGDTVGTSTTDTSDVTLSAGYAGTMHALDAPGWTTIYEGTAQAGDTTNPTITLGTGGQAFTAAIPSDARYLRLYFTQINPNALGGTGIGLKELTVNGTRAALPPSVPNVVSVASAEASGVVGDLWADLALPTHVIATLSDGTSARVQVTWDGAEHDPDAPSQTFTGQLTLPSGVTNTDALTATLTLTLSGAPTVTTCTLSPDYLSATQGTPFSGLSLPAQAVVEFSDGSVAALPVQWDESSYDPETTQSQALTGSVALPRGGSFPVSLSVQLSALPSPTPDPTPDPTPNRPSTNTPSTPADKTEVKENEDGSKTTTVTKPDGTVTETTEKPDGTVAAIETKPDGTVTETVTDPEGAKTEKVTDPDENVVITVTDPEGEELAKIEIPAEIPAPETEFEDIAQTPWAVDAINNVAALKLVNGIGNNKYDPTTHMTRGSLATVLHRLSQGKTDYATTFRDVDNKEWYAAGVAWAAKADVVRGVSEDLFAPDQIITREQLATMLCRYAKLIGINTKADAKSLETFVDDSKIGGWAVDSMAWCVENGILQGKGQNNLDPTADVSRAEVAVMLDRFISLIK